MGGKICLILIALVATNVFSIPEQRFKRSYSHNEHEGPGGYGIDSEEHNAGINDSAPCGLLDNSGSREHGYGPEGLLNHDHHRGTSTSVKAAAAASASSYS